MTRILARFRRGTDRVKLLRDLDPDYYYAVTSRADGRAQTVERLKTVGYPVVLDLYEAHGYTRLELCPACGGDGMTWYRDGRGEADKDVCGACYGEGGILPTREDASEARRPSTAGPPDSRR